jgi:hypothetical protein
LDELRVGEEDLLLGTVDASIFALSRTQPRGFMIKDTLVRATDEVRVGGVYMGAVPPGYAPGFEFNLIVSLRSPSVLVTV